MSHRVHTGQQHRRYHRNLGRRQRHQSTDHSTERRVRALRSAKGVAASTLTTGVIVLARVPYTDRVDSKVRPAVVIDADRRHVQLRPITTSDAMMRRRGGGIEIWRNGRRCWVLDTTVVVELIDVLALERDHLDDYGLEEHHFANSVTPIWLDRHEYMHESTTSGAGS